MTQELVGFYPSATKYLNSFDISSVTLKINMLTNAFIAPAGSTGGAHLRNYTGGIHLPDGHFYNPSSQSRADGESAILPNQPHRTTPQAFTRTPCGIYGGIILDHFGHFLLESTARLWAIHTLPEDQPVIFIRPPGTQLRAWQYSFLEILGLSKDRIVIANDWLQVTSLHVPESAITYHNWVAADFITPFRRFTTPKAPRLQNTWISRSNLKYGYTVGEAELEDYLKLSGWDIVIPERLHPIEQLNTFRSPSVTMGIQGSAFHLALFSPPNKPLVQLCRTQSHRAYYMLDRLAGVDSVYFDASRDLPGYPPFSSSGPFLLNLDATISFLRSRDLITTNSKFGPVIADKNKLTLDYIAWWHHTNSIQLKYAPATPTADSERNSLNEAKVAPSINPAEHVFREHLIAQTRVTDGPAQALMLSEEASQAHPLHPYYHYLCAYFLDELNQFPKALHHSQIAYDLDQNDVLFKTRYALQLLRVEHFDSASKLLYDIIASNCETQQTLHVLSIVEEKRGDLNSAIQLASQANELDPSTAHITHLFSLFIKGNRDTEALALAKRFDSLLSLSPEGRALIDYIKTHQFNV